VDDNCNSNTESNASLGNSSLNDTEIDSKQFFTGSYLFQVKDIEIFDITASIALVSKFCERAAPEMQNAEIDENETAIPVTVCLSAGG
jgi:hypothetical protein